MSKNLKVLALYLPQYYETEYNNDWWGKGYTEWVACKSAKPLFNGHYQPRVPYKYYDLSCGSDIENQAKMAKQFGVDGFVIYQYYSANNHKYGDKNGKNGRLLLNRPTEYIRDHKEIDISYCLYWANHDWKKAWFGQDQTLLWPVEYGDESDWRDYFEYNLTFFKDSRYIKVDNKPVFLIYAVWSFKNVNRFIEMWNVWAKEAGFEGIYFIKTEDAHTDQTIEPFEAKFRREPFFTFAKGFGKWDFIKRVIRTRASVFLNKLLSHFNKGIIGYTCDYDKAWKSIIDRSDYCKQIIPGAFADWDNTARKQYNSQIMIGASPEKFSTYFSELYKICESNSVPFVIINAWNEWAEGAYLEPDEKYGIAYLEVIKAIKEKG